jgi:tRNA threonylcarbamoyladenosine biosynthesis protein TsaB
VIALAIDTALNACSAAVVAEGAVRAARSEPMARGQAERLAPLVAEVMAEAGIAFSALNRVIVTTGPGSFTGVRVGLAFARTLAVSLGVQCLGVSTLQALALSDGEAGLCGGCVATPGALYVGVWRDGVEALAPRAAERGEATAVLGGVGPGVLYGPGAVALAAACGWGGHDRICPDIGALGLRYAQADPSAFPADPTYLRPAGAVLPA